LHKYKEKLTLHLMYKKLEMLFTKIAKLISMQILCLMGGTQACAHKDTMIFPKTCCTTYHPAKLHHIDSNNECFTIQTKRWSKLI